LDLSFSSLGRERRRFVALPDLAMMLAGIAAHQAASPTARAQNSLVTPIPAMIASFNAEVAALLMARQPV
jgi:hypothetical protein